MREARSKGNHFPLKLVHSTRGWNCVCVCVFLSISVPRPAVNYSVRHSKEDRESNEAVTWAVHFQRLFNLSHSAQSAILASFLVAHAPQFSSSSSSSSPSYSGISDNSFVIFFLKFLNKYNYISIYSLSNKYARMYHVHESLASV